MPSDHKTRTCAPTGGNAKFGCAVVSARGETGSAGLMSGGAEGARGGGGGNRPGGLLGTFALAIVFSRAGGGGGGRDGLMGLGGASVRRSSIGESALVEPKFRSRTGIAPSDESRACVAAIMSLRRASSSGSAGAV